MPDNTALLATCNLSPEHPPPADACQRRRRRHTFGESIHSPNAGGLTFVKALNLQPIPNLSDHHPPRHRLSNDNELCHLQALQMPLITSAENLRGSYLQSVKFEVETNIIQPTQNDDVELGISGMFDVSPS